MEAAGAERLDFGGMVKSGGLRTGRRLGGGWSSDLLSVDLRVVVFDNFTNYGFIRLRYGLKSG